MSIKNYSTITISFEMSDNQKNRFALDKILVEEDLRIVWQKNLKWREHINRAFSMAK